MKEDSTHTPVDFVSCFNIYSGLNIGLLPEKERAELEHHSKLCKVKKKSALFCEGDAPKGLYILLKGKVKFSRMNPDGSEQIFFIYSLGDMFGYPSMLSGTRHMHSIIAMEECEFLFVERENFLLITNRSKVLSDLFLNSICREFTLLTHMINVLTRRSIRERTAYFLLILNEKYKLPGQVFNEAEIKVSRSDFANYIGASLENLIRTIKEFKDKNYIRVDGKSIYIRNFEALYSLTNLGALN